MTKKLIIKNFQCHKNTCFDLSSGFNIINGPTDEGKSAIIRAIQWVCFNRPQGYGFKPHFTDKPTSVKIIFDNDQWVERYRSKTENYYACNTHQKLSALRGQVPDEIKKILNIESINIQSQFDGFFLINESSSAIGKYLNDLLNLSIIDLSIKNINAFHRENRTKYKYNKEIIDRYTKEVSELDWIDDLEKYVELYEKIQNEIKQIENKQLYLFAKKKTLQRIKQEIEQHNFLLDVKNVVLKIINMHNTYNEKLTIKEQLNKYLILIENLNLSISKFEIKKSTLKEKYNKAIDGKCPFCSQSMPV